MKRIMGVVCAVVCAVAVVISGLGCVAVSAKNNRWANELDAVVVGDKVYVVNLHDGRAAQVNLEKLCDFETLTDCDDACHHTCCD